MANYLSGWTANLSSYITPRKPSFKKHLPSPPTVEDLGIGHKRDATEPENEAWLSSTKTIDFDGLDQSTPIEHLKAKKRPRTPATKKTSKRRKTEDDTYRDEDGGSDSDLEGPTLIETPGDVISGRQPPSAQDKLTQNRSRMLPPPTPETTEAHLYRPDPLMIDKNLHPQHRIVRLETEEQELSDEELFTPSNLIRKADRREVVGEGDFDLERAQRHADAITLPLDSGYWSNAEKDLYFRLAMRGFEPLVPGNWEIDFKTLPVSLFSANDGEEAFIEPYSNHEFRAIHYLNCLLSIGRRARDRRVMSLRSEPTIRNIVRQYISWALQDAGVHPSQRPYAIPVHVLTTMRRGERTQEALDRMTRKLHKLAARFHEVHGIFPTVENHDTTMDDTLVEDGEADDIRFPPLTGILICSSIMLVVTLDTNPSRFRPLPPPTPVDPTATSSSNTSSQPDRISKEDSGLRFIATFDFSDDGMDVWNGLAIAIIVMRIRKTMREMMSKAGDRAEMWNIPSELGTAKTEDQAQSALDEDL